LSSILTWTVIVQYFAHAPSFYVLITTLRRGFPSVLRFIIGALPILIGFALCGMILFGSYSNLFRGFSNSIVTLFSAANGDAVRDTFDGIYGQNTVIALFSRIYIISFIALFTYSVINIFILIMEDAYFTVKEGGITDALKRDFKDTLDVVFDSRLSEARQEDKRRRELALSHLKERTPTIKSRPRAATLTEARSYNEGRSLTPNSVDRKLISSKPMKVSVRDEDDSSNESSSYPEISQSVESEIRFYQQLTGERYAYVPQDDNTRLIRLLEKLKRGQLGAPLGDKEHITQLSSALLEQLQGT
jgi:hypothetical protein